MTRKHLIFCLTIACCFVAVTICRGGEADFSRDVRPILADNCFECHGPDPESREAELRLDVLDEAIGWVIEPGAVDQSLLIERMLSDDPDQMMPPPHSKRRPTTKQLQIVKQWIAEGATYERHWAFVTPEPPEIPTIADPSWPRNPIDNFVASHLDAESLSPRDDAPPRLLARRLSLALIGMPILPEQSDSFARSYAKNAEQAVSAFVDQLLASESYGEHRAWFWMDAARYADTNGYQADGFRVMWPWRDWLIRNLNANLPLDRMTELMLAGDLLIPEEQQNWHTADWIADDQSSERVLATGFLRNHRYDTGSGTIPAESKFENASDRMETVATVWMGVTMLCARCHTHKYDPIENHEYYQLLSFFDNVPEVGSALKVASHPYIHTPTEQQREQIRRLQNAASDADQMISEAESELSIAQQGWEESLEKIADEPSTLEPASRISIHRVSRGLRFQYASPALELDGDTDIEKTNDPVAICAGNKRWTISFWFRPDSDKPGAIFSSVEEPQRYRPGIQADWTGSKIRVRHVCRWVNSYIEFESADTLEVGKWHHVTFRCDGRMQGLAYSASLSGNDDAMVCTHPVTNDSAEKAGNAPLQIGSSPLMPGFVGGLHELRFYDRELSIPEVKSLADPRPMAQIANVSDSQRTGTEKEILRLAFLDDYLIAAHQERNGPTKAASVAESFDRLAKLRQNQLAAHEELDEAVRVTPTTMVMKEGNTKRTRVRMAGVFDSLGQKVNSDVPDFLPPLESDRRDRLALARWLMNPAHPLTARVAVNRIWQTLWGRGLVDSPENFGTQTGEPLHSDLLDYLATQYIRSGWDTKALIKLIVTSRTYRQSSDTDEKMWTSDPTNRHLARGPRYRLPIHTVRDQALSLSGRLDGTVGGPPVLVDEVIGHNGKSVTLPLERHDRRRTLYTFWKRNAPHPMLAVFDVADRNQCEVRTMRTNTPLQALVTLNEPGFAAASEALGQRAIRAAGTEQGRIKWVWQACSGQIPTAHEMAILIEMRKNYLHMADGNESQSWTAFCNVLLNLDQTMTLE